MRTWDQPSLILSMEEEEEENALLSSLPGRELQILELLDVLGPVNSPMLPLFIYGDASTGKTSCILQIFRYLKRPFVYASCRTCYTPRLLFRSILNQLAHHAGNGGYVNAKQRCQRPADFVNSLRNGLTSFINKLEDGNEKCCNGTMIYFVFDSIELVRKRDKHLEITSMLFKLYEILKMPEVGLIFISSASLGMYHIDTGFVEPMQVHFPGYKQEELFRIFKENHANQNPLYETFLKDAAVLSSFFKVTNRVDELWNAFAPLFQKYCEPLRVTGLVPTEDKAQKLNLYSRFKHNVFPALNEMFKVPSYPNSVEIQENKVKIKTKLADADKIEFHMPVSTKLLLISSFLASWNPATDDVPLFDSFGGGENRKRKRKVSETSKLKKENAAQKLIMKGPKTFSLERLCVFVAKSLKNEGKIEDENVFDRAEVGGADVLLQLSTLCNANFLSKGGNCPLEGSTWFRCTVSEEFVMQVAKSVPFPLLRYLHKT
ncbi:hypothetical protein C5167_000424 [Papaver somniferum]|uniref:Uncharacterized protein n=1 Tax=Papaver somniferum TaxID=3469 RepID=A0A4Y7KU06_PAPSO|nr:origin of replication complex subunit 5-like [Papaver somniferum]RZC76336.1 hypothetical protein C5167_000424 [Papaver somniferum]